MLRRREAQVVRVISLAEVKHSNHPMIDPDLELSATTNSSGTEARVILIICRDAAEGKAVRVADHRMPGVSRVRLAASTT